MNNTGATALDDLLLYVLSFLNIGYTSEYTSESTPEVLLIKEFMCILNCSNTSLEALQDLEHKYTETSNTQFKKKRHAKLKVPDYITQTEKYKIRRQKNTKCAQLSRYAYRKKKKEDINELIELKKLNADLHIERDNLIQIIKKQKFANFMHNHTTYNVMDAMDAMDAMGAMV